MINEYSAHFLTCSNKIKGFPGGSVLKNLPANAGDTGDMGLIPGSRRSSRGGNGNPLQYSCLGNPMEEAGGLQSKGSQRVEHDLATQEVK